MKKKVVYLTQWKAKDETKLYPHGWGFIPPIVEFSQFRDVSEVAKACKALMSNGEFECIGVTPYPFIDGEFEVLGINPPEIEEINLDKPLSVVYYNMARNLTQEEFTKWITS